MSGERCSTCGRLSTRQRNWVYDETTGHYRSGSWTMQYLGEGKKRFTCRQCVEKAKKATGT